VGSFVCLGVAVIPQLLLAFWAYFDATALGVRRGLLADQLLDMGPSGWAWSVFLVPAIGGLVYLVLRPQYVALHQHPADAAVPAGWYDDPSGDHARRFWDGSAWTTHVDD